MKDNTASADATEPPVGDRAEVGALLVSDNWLKRLDEARAKREKVLAAQALPPIVVQPLPMARRDPPVDRFPPLEPPEASAPTLVASAVAEDTPAASMTQPVATDQAARLRSLLVFGSGIVTGVGLAVIVLLLPSA